MHKSLNFIREFKSFLSLLKITRELIIGEMQDDLIDFRVTKENFSFVAEKKDNIQFYDNAGPFLQKF
jgi:hypothetical protein